MLPARVLWEGDWRAAAEPVQAPVRKGQPRPRRTPGATVVVVDRYLDERTERSLELNATWAPVLARSFQLGWQNSCTAEMLGEFMTMTAGNLRPPTIPSVWYNGLLPYWVQQGWRSSSDVRIVVAPPSTQPLLLYPYPGRR